VLQQKDPALGKHGCCDAEKGLNEKAEDASKQESLR
jgi:hypothetical protein